MDSSHNLLDKWIEVYVPCNVETGDGGYFAVSHWCQGDLRCCQKSKPTVKLLWVAIPDCKGWNEPKTKEQTPFQSKLSKNCDTTWQVNNGSGNRSNDRSDSECSE